MSHRRVFPLQESHKTKALFVGCASLIVAAVVSHAVATWINLPTTNFVYRRIGPEGGPQVFCAGSSLLQFALSWPRVSDALDEGIESWGMAGSTPAEWEVCQSLARSTNLMILGVDVYDLNEYHVCDDRANVVPIWQTVRDLWQSSASRQDSRRLLAQYPLKYLRKLFPTAGRSDAVIVGLRRKLPQKFRSDAAAEDRANSLVMPRQPIMDFGESNEKVSDWPPSRTLRRLAGMRSENRGRHTFNGPKRLAFERMLLRAQHRGKVIMVVLPVAPAYMHEFVTPDVEQNFEQLLSEGKRIDPAVGILRLDKLTALNSDEYYSDLVHLNGAGREIATVAFLDWIRAQHFKD